MVIYGFASQAQKAIKAAQQARSRACNGGVPTRVLEEAVGVTDTGPALYSARAEANPTNSHGHSNGGAATGSGARPRLNLGNAHRAQNCLSVMLDMDVGDSSTDNYGYSFLTY